MLADAFFTIFSSHRVRCNLGKLLYSGAYTLLDMEYCDTWADVQDDIDNLYAVYVECPESELSADGLELRRELEACM